MSAQIFVAPVDLIAQSGPDACRLIRLLPSTKPTLTSED